MSEPFFFVSLPLVTEKHNDKLTLRACSQSPAARNAAERRHAARQRRVSFSSCFPPLFFFDDDKESNNKTSPPSSSRSAGLASKADFRSCSSRSLPISLLCGSLRSAQRSLGGAQRSGASASATTSAAAAAREDIEEEEVSRGEEFSSSSCCVSGCGSDEERGGGDGREEEGGEAAAAITSSLDERGVREEVRRRVKMSFFFVCCFAFFFSFLDRNRESSFFEGGHCVSLLPLLSSLSPVRHLLALQTARVRVRRLAARGKRKQQRRKEITSHRLSLAFSPLSLSRLPNPIGEEKNSDGSLRFLRLLPAPPGHRRPLPRPGRRLPQGRRRLARGLADLPAGLAGSRRAPP